MSDDEFRRMVAYFWIEKRDPTRYTEWDEARCQRLMPEFHHAWKLHIIMKSYADMAAEKVSRDTEY